AREDGDVDTMPRVVPVPLRVPHVRELGRLADAIGIKGAGYDLSRPRIEFDVTPPTGPDPWGRRVEDAGRDKGAAAVRADLHPVYGRSGGVCVSGHGRPAFGEGLTLRRLADRARHTAL